MLVCDCPPCPLSPHSVQAVLAELKQADLITSEECKRLYYSSDVVRVQSGKSPEVQSKTADVLRRHGFEKESTHLSGKQTQPLIHVPVGCCAVEPSCRATGRHPSLLCLSHTQCWVIVRVYQSHTAFPLGHLKHLLAHTKPFPQVVVC